MWSSTAEELPNIKWYVNKTIMNTKMNTKKDFIHPYIPNSVPANKKAMMETIGITDIAQLYEDIPERLRLRSKINIPAAILSEAALKKHVNTVLAKNTSCEERLSFLGGGCVNNYVPAICDEIVGRAEFLTAYAGEPYEDHGRFQALFEYESLMAELLELDVVNVPTYDWGQAASTSVRMCGRITGRSEMLVPDTISPDRFNVIHNYCHPVMKLIMVKHHRETGMMDLKDLRSKLNANVAGIYFENPSYLGFIEEQGQEIADLLHALGGEVVVGTDPSSLGVLAPPVQYGADICCGDIQSLGNHMYFGGAVGGFISSRDEEKYVMEYPSRLFGVTRNEKKGEWHFGDVAYSRTSFDGREKGKEFVGTAAALYGISTAVYLSLMGPEGMVELGKKLVSYATYTARRLAELKGIRIRFNAFIFKEFAIDFSGTGKSVAAINQSLLEKGMFGGKDLGTEFPELANCALFCVTDNHTKEDLDSLVSAIGKAIS